MAREQNNGFRRVLERVPLLHILPIHIPQRVLFNWRDKSVVGMTPVLDLFRVLSNQRLLGLEKMEWFRRLVSLMRRSTRHVRLAQRLRTILNVWKRDGGGKYLANGAVAIRQPHSKLIIDRNLIYLD
jgi:hypothetical protein